MKVTDDDIMKINFDRQGQKWMMAKNMGMAKPPGQYPELTVEKGHEGVFTFVIQSPSTVNFADKPFGPKSNGKSPADFWNQLEVQPDSTGKMITVKSKNSSVNGGTYHYELYFSDGRKLDPIIRNNGCCPPFYQQESFTYALDATAVLLLLVLVASLVIKPWMDGRKASQPTAGNLVADKVKKKNGP